MSKQDRWKALERDTADHFDALLKAEAVQLGLDVKPFLDKDGKLISRNKRGDDFGQENTDIDVVTPKGLYIETPIRGIDLHDLIGGPLIIESKYRQGNIIPRMFKEFVKSRPSSFLTPMMILSCRGKHYLARWLADFKHIDWMHGLSWDEIWITSRPLNKTNTYVEDWIQQAERNFEAKAKQFDIPADEFTGVVTTRGHRTKVLTIQRIPSKD